MYIGISIDYEPNIQIKNVNIDAQTCELLIGKEYEVKEVEEDE